MKIRTDFVTNSSSSGFVSLRVDFESEEYAKMFARVLEACVNYDCAESFASGEASLDELEEVDYNGDCTVSFSRDEISFSNTPENPKELMACLKEDWLPRSAVPEKLHQTLLNNFDDIGNAIKSFNLENSDIAWGSETDCTIGEALSFFSDQYSEDEEDQVWEYFSDREIKIEHIVEYKKGKRVKKEKNCWLDGWEQITEDCFRVDVGLDEEEEEDEEDISPDEESICAELSQLITELEDLLKK